MSVQISLDLEARREVLCEHSNIFPLVPVCNQASNTKGVGGGGNKKIKKIKISRKIFTVWIKSTTFPFSLVKIILSLKILNSNEKFHFTESVHYLKKETRTHSPREREEQSCLLLN